MTWRWIALGLLVGGAVSVINHWMSLATVRRTETKDPFANQGAIMGSYFLRLFSAGIVLFFLREHTPALLSSLFALTAFQIFLILYTTSERREGEK